MATLYGTLLNCCEINFFPLYHMSMLQTRLKTHTLSGIVFNIQLIVWLSLKYDTLWMTVQYGASTAVL